MLGFRNIKSVHDCGTFSLVQKEALPRLSSLGLAVLACFSGVAFAVEPSGFVVTPHLLMFAQLGPVAGAPKAVVSKGGDDIYLYADRVDGLNALELLAEGKVRLRRGDITLLSDQLRLDQVLNEVSAEGRVQMLHGKDRIEGPSVKLNLDTQVGVFESPNYRFQRAAPVKPLPLGVAAPAGPLRPIVASGKAEVLNMVGENQFRLRNATYTTCNASDPDWYLRVRDLSLDYDRERGEGTNSTLHFKNVPVAYVPWVEFPLNGSRQSGLLPPTFGTTTSTGFDLTVPYYLNIAPNYDATIAPRWMGLRGLQLGSEFRYLTPTSNGKFSGEYLSRDQITNTQRGVFAARNFQDLGGGLTGNVDFTQVSDRDYFSDLSQRITSTSQALLNQQLLLSYGGLPWLTTSMNVQRYQTLIGETPYARLPQISAALNVPDANGVAVRMPMEYTHFEHPTKDEGQRTVAYPQLALPVQHNFGFFTPKVGMHLSQYEVSRRTSVGPESLGRAVPIFSVDTGLNFERSLVFSERDFTQTLEPRLFYVRAASREQSRFPVYDTGRADFNFSQLFAENIYSGNDRIADSNQLTSAVTSRFIESDTGTEYMRTALGQRFYYGDQKVTLPGETPRDGHIADWLALVSGRVLQSTWVDTAYQYNPRQRRNERAVASVRYQPQVNQVFSVSYRYQRRALRDLDLSTQWPIYGGWYVVGRYNYNMKDHRLSEALAGLEYKADCWVLRFVWQTLLTTKKLDANQVNARPVRNNGLFLQLEFSGLASIGSSPVQLLKRSVGGYSKVNDNGVGDPVFGSGNPE